MALQMDAEGTETDPARAAPDARRRASTRRDPTFHALVVRPLPEDRASELRRRANGRRGLTSRALARRLTTSHRRFVGPGRGHLPYGGDLPPGHDFETKRNLT